jgi:transposase
MNKPTILFPTSLLPHAPDLLLEDVQQTDLTLLLVLRSTAPIASCPLCQQPATRIHSHYARRPADLPWGSHAVRFVLHVRTFFCLTATCPRRSFTEGLPDIAAAKAAARGGAIGDLGPSVTDGWIRQPPSYRRNLPFADNE